MGGRRTITTMLRGGGRQPASSMFDGMLASEAGGSTASPLGHDDAV
jgi:hypothetical protein